VSDEKLRELEQAFQESGSEEAEVAWLRELARAGEKLDWESYSRLHDLDVEAAAGYREFLITAGALPPLDADLLTFCVGARGSSWCDKELDRLHSVAISFGQAHLVQAALFAAANWKSAWRVEGRGELAVRVMIGIERNIHALRAGETPQEVLEPLESLEAVSPPDLRSLVIGMRQLWIATQQSGLLGDSYEEAQAASRAGGRALQVLQAVRESYLPFFSSSATESLLRPLTEVVLAEESGAQCVRKVGVWLAGDAVRKGLLLMAESGLQLCSPWGDLGSRVLMQGAQLR
jgi:hypothetical protein